MQYPLQTMIIDNEYLNKLGIKVDSKIVEKFRKGTETFSLNVENNSVLPSIFIEEPRLECENLEIHNYTGMCPQNTFEVNPIKTGCQFGCIYCLVNDGCHSNAIKYNSNYHTVLKNHLKSQVLNKVYYYFSPKSDAFQDVLIENGVSHLILQEFINHFQENPNSKVRLFIASKASTKNLLHEHCGNSIIDLLSQIHSKVQFNLSIGIMPESLYAYLEPNAPSIFDRLEVTNALNKIGVQCNSVLSQPIIGSLLDMELLDNYFLTLSKYGIKNFKPEFLTVSFETLAVIGQIVGSLVGRTKEKELYELYIPTSNQNHIKQRERLAPDRDWSRNALQVLMDTANKYNISTSICSWVRQELNISESQIPIINRNGFQCLGYQTKL